MSTDPDGHETDPGNASGVPYALGVMAFLALVIAFVVAVFGCTHPPDPLVVSADLLNASAAFLNAKVAAHNKAVDAAAQAAADRCAPLPDDARLACRSTAARELLDQTASERALLGELVSLHQTARDALHLADTCRRDGASCEASATTDAVAAVERLRAALARHP